MKGKSDETIISYIHGRVDKELESFAAALGISENFLKERIGSYLLKMGTGLEGDMSGMRSKTSQNDRVVEPMARVKHAHRNRTSSKKVRASNKKLGAATKRYWAAMTPEQRSKEMKRHNLVSKKKREAA
jgi:hypothetical protein